MLSIFQDGGETFGARAAPKPQAVAAVAAVATPDVVATPLPDIKNLKFSVLKIDDVNKVQPSAKPRVLFCGTHYRLYSGYARVVYELMTRLAKKTDIDLTLFAFQNITSNNVPRDPIEGLKVYDAMEFENPKRQGFGEKEIGDYINKNDFDIVIIYNDMSIVASIMQNIVEKVPEKRRKGIKFVCYIDQVYQYQKERYIQMLKSEFNSLIAFTDYWRDFIKLQVGKDMKVYTLPHGVNPECYFPIPKVVARTFYSIDKDAFVFVNVNRNQPRKRLDIMCMAIAEVASRHQDLLLKEKEKHEKENDKAKDKTKDFKSKVKDVRFLMGSALQGVWDIPEVLSWEFKRRNLAPELINHYIIAVSRPQQLSDPEINLLYNAADVNLNVAAGEGFGLSPIEAGCCGVPSVASDVGGHKEYLSAETAILVKPTAEMYVDNSTDQIGGLAQLCSPNDIADAMWKLYQNPKLVNRLGLAARTHFVRNFSWDVFGERLHKIILDISK